MRIEKKTWPDFFQAVIDGKKNFDIRLDDFACGVGDVIILREWDPETEVYTGREIEKEVKYILKTKDAGFWSEPDIEKFGFKVISF